MSDSASPSALLDGRVGAGQKAVTVALLWTFASLVTALAIFGFLVLLVAGSAREARGLAGQTSEGGYLGRLVSAAASRHGHPGRSF